MGCARLLAICSLLSLWTSQRLVVCLSLRSVSDGLAITAFQPSPPALQRSPQDVGMGGNTRQTPNTNTNTLRVDRQSATQLMGTKARVDDPVLSIATPHLATATSSSDVVAMPVVNSTVGAPAGAYDPQNSAPSTQLLASSRKHVSQEVAQMLYEDMILGRSIEDACAQLYYRGKVGGFVHLYNGQEAVSTGIIKALRPDDYVVSTYRDHVHATSKGVPPREVMAELFGKETGCSKGRGGSMHMFSRKHGMVGGFAFIGEQIPIALGFAYSTAYRRFTAKPKEEEKTETATIAGSDPPQNNKQENQRNDQVSVVFMGDGTVNIGQFYEAMNLASLAKLPIIFVVENNNWAIGMAAYRSTAAPELYKKAESFKIPGIEVDGMDVLAVRAAARDAIQRARMGHGPTLIDALTYRFRGHSLADPDELRATLEKEAFACRDPIVSFGNYMKSMNYTNDALMLHTKKKIREIIDDAVQFAENSADPNVETVGDYILSPSYKSTDENVPLKTMQEYAVALKAELDAQERRKSGDRTPPEPVHMSKNPLRVID